MSSPGTQIAEALGLLLLRSNRARLYGRLTAGLDPSVDSATYPVISGLARTGSMSSARLAAEVGIDRSVVSRHASRLARDGLVKRVRDPADGRAMLLVLTVRGRLTVQRMRRRLAAALDEHLSLWPPGEARRFATDLKRFVGQGLSRLT